MFSCGRHVNDKVSNGNDDIQLKYYFNKRFSRTTLFHEKRQIHRCRDIYRRVVVLNSLSVELCVRDTATSNTTWFFMFPLDGSFFIFKKYDNNT